MASIARINDSRGGMLLIWLRKNRNLCLLPPPSSAFNVYYCFPAITRTQRLCHPSGRCGCVILPHATGSRRYNTAWDSARCGLHDVHRGTDRTLCIDASEKPRSAHPRRFPGNKPELQKTNIVALLTGAQYRKTVNDAYLSLSGIDNSAESGLRERSKREKRKRISARRRGRFAEKSFAAATTCDIAARAYVGAGTISL